MVLFALRFSIAARKFLFATAKMSVHPVKSTILVAIFLLRGDIFFSRRDELSVGRKFDLPLSLLIWYHYIMKLQTKKGTKKRRGRPATGLGIQVGTRWSSEIIDQIDHWRKKEADKPARAKAIRRLVELGLKAKK